MTTRPAARRLLLRAMTKLLPQSTLCQATARRHRELVALYKDLGCDAELAWRCAVLDVSAEMREGHVR